MSKKLIATAIKESTGATNAVANQAAGELVAAIAKTLKKDGRFTIPGFGALVVKKTKARKGVNPKTGEALQIKAGKTVRFKPSRLLRTKV